MENTGGEPGISELMSSVEYEMPVGHQEEMSRRQVHQKVWPRDSAKTPEAQS